jgi:hypothetical protein
VTVIVLGLVVVLVGVALLPGLGAPTRPEVAAQVRSGDSLEASIAERWLRLRPGGEVGQGAQVRTGGTQAELRLRDGEVWLGPQALARVFFDRIELARGEALIQSRGRIAVRWADAHVSGEGVVRVAGGTSPRVGVYRGGAEVRRPGERRALAALEQFELATRRLPAVPDPLAYKADDPWDRALLGQAIAFDDEVIRIARAIDLRLGTAPRPPAFYSGFRAVGGLGVSALRASAREIQGDGDFGPPSDVLLTVFVAEAADPTRAETEADLAARIIQIGQWRAQGSAWGLVALRLGLDVPDFVRAVDLSQKSPRRDPSAGSPPRPALPDAPVAPAQSEEPLSDSALPSPTEPAEGPSPTPSTSEGASEDSAPAIDPTDGDPASGILDRLIDLPVGVLTVAEVL